MKPNHNRNIDGKTNLSEEGQVEDFRNMLIEERLAMTWKLTVQAWAEKGINVANQPVRRDIVRVTRNGPNHN